MNTNPHGRNALKMAKALLIAALAGVLAALAMPALQREQTTPEITQSALDQA